MGKPVGRPVTDKYKDIQAMCDIIEQYTASEDIPILKEVTYLNKWSYDYLMQLQREHEQLSQSIKNLLDKKEVQLERQGLKGTIDKTMAIFSLKQLGWKDKQEVDTNISFADDGFEKALNLKAKTVFKNCKDLVDE